MSSLRNPGPRITRRSSRQSSKVEAQTAEIENVENVPVMDKRNGRKKQSGSRLKISSGEDESDSQHTPPKQGRVGNDNVGVLSPRSLFEKLAIRTDDIDDLDVQLLAQNEDPKNVYQNARQVLNSAATDKLPGREQEYTQLHDLLSDSVANRKSTSVYISGQPGTGKTATLTKLLHSEVVQKGFKTAYVNCTGISSIGAIYKRLCSVLHIKIEGKSKTEKECKLAIERYLIGRSNRKMVLLVLDEIDQLMDTKQTILYTIFEWPSKFPNQIALISIANALDLTDRMLSRLQTAVALKPMLLHFQPYTKAQICAIFNERLKDAGVLDILPPVTVQLLAAKVAAMSGDVRRALDIGRRVIEIAEEQQRQRVPPGVLLEKIFNDAKDNIVIEPKLDQRPVQVSQVVSVLNAVYGGAQVLDNDLDGAAYPLQQKIAICTLLLVLKSEKNKDVTLGRLHDVYSRICNKRNLIALDQMEFVGMCELIETRGLLKLAKKKEPRLSKIRLQWDEDEVRNALQDKQLIASILNDNSPLTAK